MSTKIYIMDNDMHVTIRKTDRFRVISVVVDIVAISFGTVSKRVLQSSIVRLEKLRAALRSTVFRNCVRPARYTNVEFPNYVH